MSALLEIVTHPAFVLSLVLALLYAALFHAWQGRTLAGLGWFALASAGGFAVGHITGALAQMPAMGHVQILTGTLGSLAGLLVVRIKKA